MITCDECLDLIDPDDAEECANCGLTFCPNCSGDYTAEPICKGCDELDD